MEGHIRVSRGLFPDDEAYNDQHDTCYQAGNSDATVHLAFCISKAEMHALPMPKEQAQWGGQYAKEPQMPHRLSMPEHLSAIADAIE